MFIPVRTDYRMTLRPWVNYGLVAANAVVFLMGYNGMTEGSMVRIDHWLLHPDSPRLVQFFSSVFLHGGWTHLIGNMVFLWVFGNALNDRFGHAGYLAFYLAGGVLAGVGYVLIGGQYPVLGASGAISAVTGAYLVLFPRVRVTLLMFFYFITFFEVSSLYFLLFQFVFNLLLTVSHWGGAGGGVAFAAHSAGYVVGIVVAASLLAARILPREPFDLLNLFRAGRRRQRYRRMVAEGYSPFRFTRSEGFAPPPRQIRADVVAAETPDTQQARELGLRRAIGEALRRHDLNAAAETYLQLIQIADDAVLGQQQQLDVANQLMATERHPASADAYERFVRHYPNYQHLPDIYLMLGLLYGRYLDQPDRAETYLQRAIEQLSDERKVRLARSELDALSGRGSR